MKKDKNSEINRIKQIMFAKKNSDEEVKEIEVNEEGEETSNNETETKTTEGGAGTPGVWSSGITRGKANPIGNTKWESGITRGKANQLK
jgi:hypothetical protein